MKHRNWSFLIGVVYIAALVGFAVALADDVIPPHKPGETFGYGAAFTVFVITGSSFLFGYMAGREDGEEN
jgi:hypothetical protein